MIEGVDQLAGPRVHYPVGVIPGANGMMPDAGSSPAAFFAVPVSEYRALRRLAKG